MRFRISSANATTASASSDATTRTSSQRRSAPGARYRAAGAIRRCDEVRLVASAPTDAVVAFAQELRGGLVSATDYYISPCERDGKIDFATAKAALSRLDGWSLSVQLHKILGFR